ncbi:hypothetical protein MA16_Dca022570 [Dendrobium catenatum]|uniref:Uncharacterized protein n=1 Tax=Dendrobium catenatum TaxID=906689 RepID=A0A2I0X2W7_9ASPA|nr:hypothetical protein MA16_Dca022570 [Dendrobium catenatum]
MDWVRGSLSVEEATVPSTWPFAAGATRLRTYMPSNLPHSPLPPFFSAKRPYSPKSSHASVTTSLQILPAILCICSFYITRSVTAIMTSFLVIDSIFSNFSFVSFGASGLLFTVCE